MNGTEEEVKLKSPLRMAAILAVSVFVFEMAIMFILYSLPPFPLWAEQFIDASALSVLLFPVIYYFVFRPMASYITEISSARELIKEEKAKIEAIITGSQDAIIMMDGRGAITFWNPASEKMFGYTQDEALDRNLHELIVPERFRNNALKGLQTFKDTGQGPLIGVILEHAGLRKDGTEFYAEHSISALKIKGEWHALGIVRDITERRQAEDVVKSLVDETQQKYKDLSALVEKLTQSEEKYRTIIEHAGDMIWTLDTEGRFIFANKSAEEISGYKIEDWVGKPFAALIAEDLPKIMEVFQKTLKGEPQRFEVTIIHADGRRVVLSVNSAPLYSGKQVVGAINFGRDITALKKAEKEIMERIDELERFRKATVQREFRIKELKDENEELKRKLGIHKA